jgi:hypothetical protein
MNTSSGGKSDSFTIFPRLSGNSLRYIGHMRQDCVAAHWRARRRSEISMEREMKKEGKVVELMSLNER